LVFIKTPEKTFQKAIHPPSSLVTNYSYTPTSGVIELGLFVQLTTGRDDPYGYWKD